jgi:hypothetical protein
MSYPEGFWTTVAGCGCIYGSLLDYENNIRTPMQAWAKFWEGDAPGRKKAEARGDFIRPAEAGDLDALRADWPHEHDVKGD